MVAVARARLVEIEAVGVLHQELAAAHHPEARPDLIAEFPLDVVKRPRQVAVALEFVPDERGQHLLVGRAVEHLAVMPVANAQHLGTVSVVAAALAPQLGRLQRRHQHFLRARAVLLLPNDLLDLLEHSEAQRQPGVDPGRGLAHQAGAQHQLVADDLGVGGALLEHRQEGSGPAHGGALYGAHLRLATAPNACGPPDTAVRQKPRQRNCAGDSV